MGPARRRIDAFGRGAADILSLGFADEIAAGADALIGRGRGDSLGERYQNNVAVKKHRPIRCSRCTGHAGRGAGRRVGSRPGSAPHRLLSARAALLRRRRRCGLWRGRRRSDAEGSLVQRAPNALIMGSGPSQPPSPGLSRRPWCARLNLLAGSRGANSGRAANALGVPGADRLAERSTPNALRQGLERWAERFPPRDLEERVVRMTEADEPTFSDITDEAGRGMLRALATRQTPARQAAREFADSPFNIVLVAV